MADGRHLEKLKNGHISTTTRNLAWRHIGIWS